MIPLRIMLPEGEQKFRDYISQAENNPATPRPDLNTPPYSEEFPGRIEIDESRAFSSKMELAEYLDGIFTQAGLKREEVIEKNGLWTWLAYLWFDQFAPVDNRTGHRKVNEKARYICSSDYTDYHRHLVAGPYSIYSLHKNNSRIFLYNPVDEVSDFMEQIASRQFLISHQNLIEAFSTLYSERASGVHKRGAQYHKRPGNIRRFVKIIQQFELTYDIYSMSPQQIVDLLPDEFEQWKRT
jgi:hypothetical protein